MNSVESPEDDINDVFSSIACSEETLSRTAFEEGRLAGAQQGEIEGYHLGYHRGAEIGFEIGSIEAFARVYLTESASGLKEKTADALRRLIALCDRVPKSNNLEFDLEGSLSEIRAGYKKVLAMLKLPVVLPISSPATQF